MYGARPLEDAMRALRAWAANEVARLAPRAYLAFTGQTGRGAPEGETVAGIAEYFLRSFYDYFEVLHVSQGEIAAYLRGKTLLEYGPGDTPGVALLMAAHGAEKVFCVDRFPMLSLAGRNSHVLAEIARVLEPDLRARAASALARHVEYLVRPRGLSGLREEVDLAFSRAVLEHVDDLDATFADMAGALKPGGTAVHKVDLRSHGLHRRNPLDFLSWPQPLWTLMYSHKGVPNRWRVDRYREAARACGLRIERLLATGHAAPADLEEVRPHLAAPFRGVSDEDLSWLGFWLVCRK